MTCTLTDDVRTRLARVKLLVLDVDGVLTDGSLYYTERGEEIKKFHVRDGQGIKLVQQVGIAVVLMSGNASTAVEQRARVLGIPDIFLGVNDKKDAVCHVEGAFYFTTKVSVTRGINNVNSIIVVLDGRYLGGNSNAAFPLLVTTIHNELLAHFGLVIPEGLGLF